MPHHRSNTKSLTANSNGNSKFGWGAIKLIGGALCRQCRRCRKWFHIGWIAYHTCRAPLPRSE